MTTMPSQITSLTIVYSTVYSDADQIKHQSSASLAFVWEIHRGPVNFPHKRPVTRKMFPFDDVIMHAVDSECNTRCGNRDWSGSTCSWAPPPPPPPPPKSLQWRHNGRNGVSNHRCLHCLLNCLFRRRSMKASKLRVTVLCAANWPVTGEIPAQRANNAENVSIWWRHHVMNDLLKKVRRRLCTWENTIYEINTS